MLTESREPCESREPRGSREPRDLRLSRATWVHLEAILGPLKAQSAPNHEASIISTRNAGTNERREATADDPNCLATRGFAGARRRSRGLVRTADPTFAKSPFLASGTDFVHLQRSGTSAHGQASWTLRERSTKSD